ncbi:hypothetical protein F9B16_03070 [Actinomadura montaniterrae]|uniref:Uncharacterized protein n=1 Tax=Actinomadura montaniterrae TaxID=1803903 RepID=A0A6L3W1F8_9ACTN|nr:hypothetical protein F9B16_03070 [Actinomadura montaniterrae]
MPADEGVSVELGRFPRVEPRRQARAYVTGLLAPVEPSPPHPNLNPLIVVLAGHRRVGHVGEAAGGLVDAITSAVAVAQTSDRCWGQAAVASAAGKALVWS